MGQCGCGDFYPHFQLPGPDGSVYTISLHQGCNDCETPAGVIITRLKGEALVDWDVKYLPQLHLRGYGFEPSPDEDLVDAHLAIVKPEVLRKHLNTKIPTNERDSFDDSLKDALDEGFRDAVLETMAETIKIFRSDGKEDEDTEED